MMIFVPVDHTIFDILRATGELTGALGFAPTAALRAGHEYGPGEDEEAEFAAFSYASTWAIATAAGGDRGRLVLAVASVDEVDSTDYFGRVEVPVVRWSSVQAVFIDEVAAVDEVRRLAAEVAGRDLASLWDDPRVARFTEEHELLWHLPTELEDPSAPS